MSTVPLTVTPEAEALIAELGLHEEMMRMVEWVRQNATRLRSIEVVRKPDYGRPEKPLLIICPHRDAPPAGTPLDMNDVEMTWGEWKARNCSLRACNHFIMLSMFHPVPDAA
jgi:hypothetical protein